MIKRRRFKRGGPFQDRLAAFVSDAREEADKLPPDAERDKILRKASRADTAAHLDEWANSPGLQPPKK